MPPTVLVSKPGEARDAVVLVDDEVAGAQVGEAAQQAAAAAGRPRRRLAPVDQPVLRDRGELEAGRDEAVAQARLLEDEPLAVRRRPSAALTRARLYAARSPWPRFGHVTSGGVAGADELLELRLGLLEASARRTRRPARGTRAPALPEMDDSRSGAALLDRGEDAVGLDVEVVRVGVVERGADVVPVVAQRRLGLLLGGEDQLGLVRQEVEQLAEVADGQQLGDVRALVRALQRGDLGQLAVLGGELGGGGDLDDLGVAERALREGGEPAQRLDLVVEQVDADRALLRGRVDVEQAAADGELAAVVDLVDALVARGDEVGGGLVEVEQLADAQREAVRAQRRVRDLLAQRDRGDDDDRRLADIGSPAASAVPRSRLRRRHSSTASSAATRRPTRCAGGVRCDS